MGQRSGSGLRKSRSSKSAKRAADCDYVWLLKASRTPPSHLSEQGCQDLRSSIDLGNRCKRRGLSNVTLQGTGAGKAKTADGADLLVLDNIVMVENV